MKKIYVLLIALCIAAFNVNAQKWVSTTPQNKKVVLEEFTGIHCGYCPDGHRMANDLVTANPGNVFLVNIHAGGFATPATGEPDFRTTEGNALNTAAAVTGYPSGSINRSTTPWGQSRANWTSLASGILAQSSPVNVAVKSSVDFATRTLTTEVEVYYTANSTVSTNKLTVMLLQSDYTGYQSDYGNYNPTNWCSNGDYKHNHVLRMVLSANGASGQTLDTTTATKYYYKKYVTVLPASIVNVNINQAKLSVIAFVSETQAQVYNAAEADVTFDNANVYDLSMVDQTAKPATYCFTSINPKIEVTNNSDKAISNFDVNANIGGVDYPKTYTGTLAAGAKTTIDWGSITYSAKGQFSFSINGYSNVNTGSMEDIGSCDNKSSFSGIGFTASAFSTVSASFEGTVPNHFAFDKTDNPYFSMYYSNSGNIGAKNTKYGIGFPIMSVYGVDGKAGRIMFGEADFTTMSNPYFTFYYAWSNGGTTPTPTIIKVEVSEDCGATWTELRSITCENTFTCTNNGQALYAPKTANYYWVGVPLADYKNKKVLLRVSGIPGNNGNSLWLDEFSITEATGITESDGSLFNINIYPNPVQDVANIEFTTEKRSLVSFEVYNSLGQSALTVDETIYAAGKNNIEVNTSSLAQGCYVARLTIDGKVYTTKLVK